MDNLALYNEFRKVPNEAKKIIGAGRLKGFTDINPMWRIKKLTEKYGLCGIGWYYKIIDKRIIEGGNNEKAAFVDIELFIKTDNEWSMPIVGTGGSSFVAMEKKGLYTSDEAFKMALTDAISIACKALGMGADVYFEKDRTKYDQEQSQQKQKEEYEEFIKEGLTELDKCKTPEEVHTIYPKYRAIANDKRIKTKIIELDKKFKDKK